MEFTNKKLDLINKLELLTKPIKWIQPTHGYDSTSKNVDLAWFSWVSSGFAGQIYLAKKIKPFVNHAPRTIHQNGQYNTHLFYSTWIKIIQEGPLSEMLVGFTNPSKVYHGLSRNPLFLVGTKKSARCSAATSEALGYHEHHGLAEAALQPAKREVPRHGRCREISAGNMAIWLPFKPAKVHLVDLQKLRVFSLAMSSSCANVVLWIYNYTHIYIYTNNSHFIIARTYRIK